MKKNYIKPKLAVCELTQDTIIASSYMEEGVGDGGGPRASMRGTRYVEDIFGGE